MSGRVAWQGCWPVDFVDRLTDVEWSKNKILRALFEMVGHEEAEQTMVFEGRPRRSFPLQILHGRMTFKMGCMKAPS